MQQREILRCTTSAETRDKIVQILAAQGIPTHTPCLKLELSSAFSLEESDVLCLMSRFGSVRSIRVLGSLCLVLFKDITSAYFAQKVLHKRSLGADKGEISLTWYTNQEEEHKEEANPCPKFTCKIDIQIPNDKDFQVARRLIGRKGHNMKKIVDACSKGLPGKAHNVVKIRLRGRGSGFREGPNRTESDEPLHICISSKYEDKYNIAVQHIESLVDQVYREYSEFCRKKNLPDPALKLKQVSKERDENREELIDIRAENKNQLRDILKDKGIVLSNHNF